LKSAVSGQQEEIKALAAAVKEQAAQMEKVNAQLHLGKAAPRLVANTQ